MGVEPKQPVEADDYDVDFFAWTAAQAAAIVHEGGRGVFPPSLDWRRLADKAANLGQRDLKDAMSLTRRILEHLYLLEATRRQESKARWRAEIEADLERGHVAAARVAAAHLAADEPGAAIDPARRWSLAEITGESA